MIRFQMEIDSISDYQRGNLPAGAIRLNTPTTADTMKKSVPIMVIICVLMNIAVFYRFISCKEFSLSLLSLTGIAAGCAVGFALLIVHELLHAIVYPKDAEVTVGKRKGRLLFTALASYPLSRPRFFVMCLLPFLLGILPLMLFLCGAPSHDFLNFFWFGMACIGMVSPSVDVYNVLTVRKQSKLTDRIMFYEEDIYRIAKE